MKRSLLPLLLVLLLPLFLSGCFKIMDEGGMMNLDYDPETDDIEMLDGDGSVFDAEKDLKTDWFSEEGYSVLVGDETLALSKDGETICECKYTIMDDDTILYPKDGAAFDIFSRFEYIPSKLTGIVESDNGEVSSIEFWH